MKPLAQLVADWPQVNSLLDEALSLPPAQRTAWLDALDGKHDAVKDTLRRLLTASASAETSDLLSTLPKLGAAALAAGAEGPGPGDCVGPWRLLRELGEGGMGSVWLAEHTDGHLKRKVALKLPLLSWARGLAERMARERDILATLEHPHIARLYDAGVDSAGRPWLALEHVPGLAIDRHAQQAGLRTNERLALLQQVCGAVAYAHAHLVIHRDLKPGNVMVTAEGQVKLLDFGIAKLIAPDRPDSADADALTEMAGRPLTLDYASPEQIRGEPLTTASDVYSLGVLAYVLLSGQRPYRLDRSNALGLAEVIARADVPAASVAAARANDLPASHALRGNLDAILNKALKKDPRERYASVDALAEDLRRHQAREPVSARPDSLGYRAVTFVRRYRVQAAAGAAIAVSLLVGIAVALWQAQTARQAERQALQQRQRAELASNASALVSNLMMETFSRLAADPLLRDKGARERLGQALRDGLRALEPQAAAAPEAVAEAHGAAASIFNYLGQAESQLESARREQQLLKLAGADPVRIAETHRQIALAFSRRSDQRAAIDELRLGLALLPDSADVDVRVMKTRLNRALGRYARILGLMDLSHAAATASIQSFEGLALELHPEVAHHFGSALADFAVSATAVERDQEALAALARADALYAKIKVPNEADRADIELARCTVLTDLGRFDAARRACLLAGALYAPQFGAASANADRVDMARVDALLGSGALQEAGDLLERVRNAGRGVTAWLASGDWALARSDPAQAARFLAQQPDDARHAVPPKRLAAQVLRARIAQAQGRFDEAAAAAKLALAQAQTQTPGARRMQRVLRLLVAETALARGRVEEARAAWAAACGRADPPPAEGQAQARCRALAPALSSPAAQAPLQPAPMALTSR